MDSLFTLNKVEPLFKKLDKNHELEVMFNNYKEDNKLSIEDFIRVTKMLKLQSQKDKKSLKQNISLDIIYQQNNLTKYRLSVNGRDKINKLVNLVIKRSNNVILTVLLSKYGSIKTLKSLKFC